LTVQPHRTNLVDRLVDKKRQIHPSIFSLHDDHHASQKVDSSSYQAKRLGLAYLGFGRYGLPSKKKGNQQFDVTHVVRNGLLIPLTTGSIAKEDGMYPPRNSEHMLKFYGHQTNNMQREIDAFTPEKQAVFFAGKKCLDDYLSKDYHDINSTLFSGIKPHPSISGKINRIDKLFGFNFAKLHSDIPLYTSLVDGAGPTKKGEAFEFRGYLSASANPKTAMGLKSSVNIDDHNNDMMLRGGEEENKSLPHIIQLDMKKNQRALDTTILTGGPSTLESHEPDDEFILPRNSRFIIVNGPIYLKNAIVWRAKLDQTDDDFNDDLNK
jgi:hypothetical protein